MHIILLDKILLSVGFYKHTHSFLDKLSLVKSPHIRVQLGSYGFYMHLETSKGLMLLSQKIASESERSYLAGYEAAKKDTIGIMLLSSEEFKGGKA